jgi:hypothetical protein
MPLLDHFHLPVKDQFPWDFFHSSWATRIADALNERLPSEFIAAEVTHAAGSLEIDVATFERAGVRPAASPNGPGTALVEAPAYAPAAPAAPAHTIPVVFPDTFEVRVFSTSGGLTLVAAIELVSPGNKDRPDERNGFAVKCASYLHQGVAVILMDVVTSRRGNLHNETMRLLNVGEVDLPADASLYAVAYRPVRRGGQTQVDLWTAPVALGESLPTMPLRLTGDLFVPVEFEPSYMETRRRRRLA